MPFVQFIATAGERWPLGTTVVAVVVSLLAGFLSGRLVWRIDRRNLADAERVIAGLKQQLEEIRKSRPDS